MENDTADAPHSRVFHVLEVCRVAGAHKQALANHACVQSSLKTMSASVHEAEVLLNAAVIDLDEPGARTSCLPDDDPRVEAIVSVMNQDGSGKTLVSLRNVAAERYWGTRWKREWQAKYHDPLVASAHLARALNTWPQEIRRQEREDAAMGGLDACMQRRREQRVRSALKDLVKKPEFDPILRARGRAQDFVSLRRKGQGGRCLGGRPRTAFGATNKPAAAGAQQAAGKTPTRGSWGGDRGQGRLTALPPQTASGKLIAKSLAPVEPSLDHHRRCRSATYDCVSRKGTPGKSTFGRCPRFPGGTEWDSDCTARALSRLAKVDPPVRDYTEGALGSTNTMAQVKVRDSQDFSEVYQSPEIVES